MRIGISKNLWVVPLVDMGNKYSLDLKISLILRAIVYREKKSTCIDDKLAEPSGGGRRVHPPLNPPVERAVQSEREPRVGLAFKTIKVKN